MMGVRHVVGAAAWRIERVSRASTAGLALERLVAGWSARGVQLIERPAREHLLVPTVGLGNVGDQAMFEAFLNNTAGSVSVVSAQQGSHGVPPEHRDRVQFVDLPGLVDRPWWRNRRQRQQFRQIAAEHRWVSVIGADVMDGGYDPLEAVARLNLLRVASGGSPGRARVLGFSWNGRPHPQVRAALSACRGLVDLYVRDPQSLQRLEEIPGVQGIACADMVFCLEAFEAHPPTMAWLTSVERAEAPVVLVNASGLLLSRRFLVDEYRVLIKHLLDEGRSVVLLPHVVRAGDDDSTACALVAEPFLDHPGLRIVTELLTPGQVAWLAALSEVVVTGRMHLAILALSQSVPAAVLSTQGKVAGLLRLFDLEQHTLEPSEGLGLKAVESVEVLRGDDIRRQVSEKLPHVRDLARLNFAGMDGP